MLLSSQGRIVDEVSTATETSELSIILINRDQCTAVDTMTPILQQRHASLSYQSQAVSRAQARNFT